MAHLVAASRKLFFPHPLGQELLGDPGDPKKSLTIVYISPLFNQCVSVIQKKLQVFMNFVGFLFMPKNSNPGEVGSWMWTSWKNQVRSFHRSTSYLDIISCFDVLKCVPPFLGRDSLSFSSYSTCLHQIQAELQHHVAYQRYTPPKTNMEPENGGPLEKEIPIGNHHFSGSMLNIWSVGVIWWKLSIEIASSRSRHARAAPICLCRPQDGLKWLTPSHTPKKHQKNEVIFMAIECHPIVFSRSAFFWNQIQGQSHMLPSTASAWNDPCCWSSAYPTSSELSKRLPLWITIIVNGTLEDSTTCLLFFKKNWYIGDS